MNFPEHKDDAGDLVIAYGICSTCSKLLYGPIADIFPSLYARFLLYSMGIGMKGFFTTLTPYALHTVHSFSTSVIMSAMYALGDAAQFTVYTPLVQRIVGSAQMGNGMGLAMAAAGLTSIVGPSLGGLAYGMFGGYTIAFVVSGVTMMLTSLLMFAGHFGQQTTHTRAHAFR